MHELRICTYVIDNHWTKEVYPNGKRVFVLHKVHLNDRYGIPEAHTPIHANEGFNNLKEIEVFNHYVSKALEQPVLDLDNEYEIFKTD